jgi:hypothetical protein
MSVKVTRKGIGKVSAIAVLAVLLVGGAVGVYFYTAAPTNNGSTTGSVVTSTSGTVTGPGQGTCTLNAQGQCETPEGAWADYLGYIPAGYVLAPHYFNAPTIPCPSGMGTAACTQFKAPCGNGVCDPNESCATCPIDCGIPGQLTCDPYTGRAGAPISICQMVAPAPAGQAG